METNGKQYRIDIPGYQKWEDENGLGMVTFTDTDIVTVQSIDDEWARGVYDGRMWYSAIPANLLIEVRS